MLSKYFEESADEDTDNKDIVWTSSDENIVTVSNGKIKCKEYGTAVITAETANGKKAECNVVVEKYRTDLMIKMLKSGFGDLTNDEITDLENYAIKYKIRGTMWKRPLCAERASTESRRLCA